MLSWLAIVSSLLAVQCHSQDPGHSTLDPTAALLEYGIDTSKVPGLDPTSEQSSLNGCSRACGALQFLYQDQVLGQSTQAYDNFTSSYWSAQQAAVRPSCVFKPVSSSQVAVHVLVARLTKCPFAIKSGGHAAFAGASAIDGGITLALDQLNVIQPSSRSVLVGPGNRWHDVYKALESKDIAVIGGRVSAIGVGGLTLGGGISFFSNIYGWACDNVLSYQIVTASGAILNVSDTQYPDLYWGLRGGGNNFGIVTNFELRSIPLPGGRMWGGTRLFASVNITTGAPNNAFPQLVTAFTNLGSTGAITDPQAAQILSFTSAQGLELAAAALQYGKPVADPQVFAEYLSIPGYLSDSTYVRTLTNLTDEFAASNPDGRRETYWVASYKLTEDMVTAVKDIFYEELPSVINATGIVPAATLQVITVPQMEAMKQRGGNALGLDPSNGPLLLLNMNVQWEDVADDKRIMDFNSRIIDRTVQYAEQHELASEYLYMNYASQSQDVFDSYGELNKMRLKQVAQKYDPQKVFQTLVPGGFKLD